MSALVEPPPAPTSAQERPRERHRGLDVVVVNYRTPDDLNAFLASYAAHPCAWPGSLTAVNVAPLAADLAVVDRWQGTVPMNHLTFDDNVGYARACNGGAMLGSGDVVALFNADVVLRAEALTSCYEAIRSNPGWGVLGPRQVDARNRLVGCGIVGTNTQPRHRAWMETDVGQCSDVLTDTVTVSGSAYFVRREVWRLLTDCPYYRKVAPDATGAFLPTPHYYEETFCSYHARAHGLAVVYFGPVVITHLWHRASPPGGHADQLMSTSKGLYRAACEAHGIEHE